MLAAELRVIRRLPVPGAERELPRIAGGRSGHRVTRPSCFPLPGPGQREGNYYLLN